MGENLGKWIKQQKWLKMDGDQCKLINIDGNVKMGENVAEMNGYRLNYENVGNKCKINNYRNISYSDKNARIQKIYYIINWVNLVSILIK